MASGIYYVGFESVPKDLEAFLKTQGYNRPNIFHALNNFFESRDGLVDMLYWHEPSRSEKGVPNWGKAGFNVVSEVFISTEEVKAAKEAEKIAVALARRYNAVLYNPSLDDYSRADKL